MARTAAAQPGGAERAREGRRGAADAAHRPDRRDLLDRLPRLRAIANYAVGYDNIDVTATAARGIPVGNTPDVLTDATADLTFALLLAAARRLPEALGTVHDGDWLPWEPARYLGADVYGATLGIVGMGRIGRAVAARARGFEMTVLSAGRDIGQTLAELLARSDFVSLHCPLTPATRHLIDADALSHMRRTAILVNTARGPIVDQHALREALVAGVIAGAALDVTDPEPLPPDDPLLERAEPDRRATHRFRHPDRARADGRPRGRQPARGASGEPMPHQVV